MLPIVAQLIASGIGVLGNAIASKGKEYIEDKLGVEIPDGSKPLTPEQLVSLREVEFKHEETLKQLAIRQAEIDLEGEKVAQGAVTERWKADVSSDSWASKNIRPAVLAYWTVAISLLIFLDSLLAQFEVKQAWIDLIETSYSIVLAAYFVGRTVQHVTNIRSKTP